MLLHFEKLDLLKQGCLFLLDFLLVLIEDLFGFADFELVLDAVFFALDEGLLLVFEFLVLLDDALLLVLDVALLLVDVLYRLSMRDDYSSGRRALLPWSPAPCP